MSSAEDEKWVRHNIAALFDGQPFVPGDTNTREKNKAECDRIMIALHRFQTIGRVSYRRLLGMHGGGGGTSSEKFRDLLLDKVNKDIDGHYEGKFPDGLYWPNAVPNAPPPTRIGAEDPDRCFAYTFCWHGQPELLVWHRALVSEFERGLQEHDPKFINLAPDDGKRHKGSEALGCPYWAWEGWDGLTLPQVVSNELYVVKTDAWTESGYPKGSVFNNPFHRWLAPVTIEDQKKELFPPIMTHNNTTNRDAAFGDAGSEFNYAWPQVTDPQNPEKNPSMRVVVEKALSNANWNEFSTTKFGGAWSIENPHNKFHNHVGGISMGGIQGPGAHTVILGTGDSEQEQEYGGTMTHNQSIFDPMFWLHHGNVERQFVSWQLKYSRGVAAVSIPSEDQQNTVLYPWTKPECLWNGEMSWNTPSDTKKDATFRDWWDHETLPYRYDEYLATTPAKAKKWSSFIDPVPPEAFSSDAVRMTVFIDAAQYKGGEYTFWKGDELIGTISILSAQGGVCARCAGRKLAAVVFEVSDTFDSIDDADKAFDSGKLRFTRNGKPLQIEKVKVERWNANE
jgi:hypothetical protein